MLYVLKQKTTDNNRFIDRLLLLLLSVVFLTVSGYLSADQSSAHIRTPAGMSDAERSPSGAITLPLLRTDQRYSLASAEYSSGFIVADQGQNLAGAPQQPGPGISDLTPDFRQHKRYWLYVQVENQTDETRWVLHVSNFGFKQPAVRIRRLQQSAQDEVEVRVFDTSGRGSADINTIGRALPLTLEPGLSYQLVVELTGEHFVWYPYIALMSEPEYRIWKAQMDLVYKLGIGIVLGMVLLGLICWLLMSEITFFWASLSSFLMLIYYLEHSSLPEIFWQYSYDKNPVFWALVSLTLLGHLMFSASFLRIGKESTFLYRVFLLTGVATVVIQSVILMVPLYGKVLLTIMNYTLVWLVILGSGIYKVRTDGRYYILYLLGWLPLVLSTFHVVNFILFRNEAGEEINVSYKMIVVLYTQILHMLVHAVALLLRVRAMREEKEQAEFLSQAKSRFIAQSSHDLRQPLHSMNIFLESLKPYIRGAGGMDIFDRLRRTHRQMSESFSSIMDLTRLESGVIRPEIQTLSLADLLSRLQHEYRMYACAKNIQLNFHSCSLEVISDPLLLERMLRNLISNAIKYTEAGRVVVGCRRRGQQVLIQVSDTGWGIEREDQDQIFDIYHRSAGCSERINGSGIGLSVVRHLSELLGHPLSMASVPRKGSTFTVSVPQAAGPDIRLPEADAAGNCMPPVALVLQNSELRQAVSERLGKWQCRVQIFCSWYELQQQERAADVLICDAALLSDLTDNEIQQLAGEYVAACICGPDVSLRLPDQWFILTLPVLPSRLRALLNFAVRYGHSAGDTVSDVVSAPAN